MATSIGGSRGVGAGTALPTQQNPAAFILKVDELIQKHATGAVSNDEAKSIGAERVQEASKLSKSDLSLGREALAKLTFLPINKVQNKAIAILKGFLGHVTFSYDFEKDRVDSLLRIALTLSTAVDQHIRKNGASIKVLKGLLIIYGDLLEHLWVLPHMSEDSAGCHAAIKRESQPLRFHSSGWLDLLAKYAEKVDGLSVHHSLITKGLDKLGKPIPEHISLKLRQIKNQAGLPPFVSFIGDMHHEMGDLDRANICFKECIQSIDLYLSDPANISVEAVREELRRVQIVVLGNQGVVFCKQCRYEKAIDSHGKALKVAKEVGDIRGKGDAYANLGNAYMAQGQYEKAVKYHLKGLKIAQERGDRHMQALVHSNLGSAFDNMGDYRNAIEQFQECMTYAREIKDPLLEAKSLGNLGSAYAFLGDVDKAMEFQEQNLAIASRTGDKYSLQVAYSGLGSAMVLKGDCKKAIEYQKKSLELAQWLGDLQVVGVTHGNLGGAYEALGDYPKAIKQIEKSLEYARKIGARLREEQAIGNLASLYTLKGDFSRAVKFQEESLALAVDIGDRKGESNAHFGLGNIYRSLGNYSRAKEEMEKSLTIAIEIGDKLAQSVAYNGIGEVVCQQGDYKSAISQYEASLKIDLERGVKKGAAASYGSIGVAYSLLNDSLRSIENYEKGLRLSFEAGDRRGIATSYVNLGIEYRQMNEWLKALDVQLKGLKIHEEIGDEDGIANCLFNLGVSYISIDDVENALRFLQRANESYSEIQRKLGRDEWKISIFERQAQSHHFLELLLYLAEKPLEALEVSEGRRSKALIDTLFAEKSIARPANALSVDEIREVAIQQHTHLLFYSLAPVSRKKMEAIVWLANPEGGINHMMLPLDSLAEDMDGFMQMAQRILLRGTSSTTRSILAMGEVEELTRGRRNPAAAKARAFREKLKEWHAALIAPIKEHLPEGAKLTIVPDGFLSQLPFAIFMDEEGKYLIEDHPISIAPSVQVLKLLQDRKEARELPEGSLVVGNPEAGIEAAELPMAEVEAQKLRELLGTPDEKVFMRGEAKVGAITEAMKGAKYIHFACHGEQDLKTNIHSVFEGAFLLSPDKGHEKGLLYSEQIGELNVSADLVYLSACKSGKGAIKREGTIGPMRSFLAAGASSVVGTLWSLPDSELTVDMVTGFYERVLEGMRKDEALREVMLMAIERKRNAPHGWGAFVLTGLAE